MLMPLSDISGDAMSVIFSAILNILCNMKSKYRYNIFVESSSNVSCQIQQCNEISWPVFTCSKLTIETLEQGVNNKDAIKILEK